MSAKAGTKKQQKETTTSAVLEKAVIEEKTPEVKAQETPKEESKQTIGTKVSIHKHANPYAVKSDFIYYPDNETTFAGPLVLYIRNCSINMYFFFLKFKRFRALD